MHERAVFMYKRNLFKQALLYCPATFLFPSDRRSAVNYNRSYNKIISLYPVKKTTLEAQVFAQAEEK